MKLDYIFIQQVLPDSSILGNRMFDLTAHMAAHDSRNVVSGGTFFALAGSVADGHDFIDDAIGRGAKILVLAHNRYDSLAKSLESFLVDGGTIILVSDTTEALIALAAAWRAQFSIPVIGVTGSIGKTTTKELLAFVLHRAGHTCLVSPGNFNTRIGLAVTLLRLTANHTVAICEMGISQAGEMAQLAALVRPTMALITTIAHQHMDCLENLAAVAREKRQIFSCMPSDGIGFINGDVPLLHQAVYHHPVVRFGLRKQNQVNARKITFMHGSLRAIIQCFGNRFTLNLPIPHAGFLNSVLAVLSVCQMLEVDDQMVIEAVEDFIRIDGRFALKNGRYGLLINDAYNANPESMREALLAFHRMQTAGKKVAILGDMGALGERSLYWHRQIGRTFRTTKSVTHAILVGPRMAAAAKTMPHVIRCSIVECWQDVPDVLASLADEGPIDVLLKGSNAVGLMNLAPLLS